MKTLSPRRTDQEWMELIEECRNSGLSDKAWCREHGICTNTFYYHIRQLRVKSCAIPDKAEESVPKKQEIVSIDFSSLCSCESEETAFKMSECNCDVAVLLDYHGIGVKVINTASGSVIYETLKALQKLC